MASSVGHAGADAVPRRLLELALVDDVEQFLRLGGVEVQAVAADELERVPRRRIVAAGDGHAALRAEPADGELQRGRRRDAEIDHLAAGREQPGDDGRLDHRPRRSRVAADEDAARVEIRPEGLGKRDDELGCQGFADDAADAADADLERTHDGEILLRDSGLGTRGTRQARVAASRRAERQPSAALDIANPGSYTARD